MQTETRTTFEFDYRQFLRSPFIFHLIGLFFAAISSVIVSLLPSGKFLIAPGVLGDKWRLFGLIVVLLVIEGINFIVANTASSRDKVLFWVVSVATAIVSAGVLIKVASVAYFW